MCIYIRIRIYKHILVQLNNSILMNIYHMYIYIYILLTQHNTTYIRIPYHIYNTYTTHTQHIHNTYTPHTQHTQHIPIANNYKEYTVNCHRKSYTHQHNSYTTLHNTYTTLHTHHNTYTTHTHS